AVFLYLALLGVWLTRRALWLLMVIGHALSCFMLRQMEFDADRNEIRLVGTEAFAATARQGLLLGLVKDTAQALAAGSSGKTGPRPDDLGALIVGLAGGVSPENFRQIEKELAKVKPGFFDTHPSDGDRLASARRENAPGVFHLGGPAARLFK